MITLDDLLLTKRVLWPDVKLYDKQLEIADSTLSNHQTFVRAGNKLGKDFIAAFIALGVFRVALARGFTCRIVTTSVAEHHLKVLWGEIGRFLTTAKQPMLFERGGPLVVNYLEVRRESEREAKNPLNYLVGRVSAKGEGLAGHHADYTLIIGDEASGLDDEVLKMAEGWAAHMLWIGNPNNCQNFYRKGNKAGDRVAA